MSALAIVPPAVIGNAEAEAALIGGLMVANKQIDAVADKLSPEDFSDPFFAQVYAVIIREHSLGRAPNPITLRPYFNAEQYGVLAQLTGSGANVVGIKDNAEQIKSLAQRRRLIDGLQSVIAQATLFETPVEQLIDAADAAVTESTLLGDGMHQPTGAECIGEVLDGFNAPTGGVSCGRIEPLDRLLGPLKPKQLVILAARPGMGKTAVALSYAVGAARNGHGVLFVSLEMSSTELGARMAADMIFDGKRGVQFSRINAGVVTNAEGQQVTRAQMEMEDLPFRVVDIGTVQIGRLNMMVRRHARRFAAKGQKLELVVVDYLQLVSPDQRCRSNYEAVSEVSRGLKAIAKTHGVAVLALAQLSREVEKRPDKRPNLSDLRDSGQIEQDADAVMFLLRPEYYIAREEPPENDQNRQKWEAMMADAAGRLEFICAKRRNGPEGKGEGVFYGQYQAVRG